MSHNTPQHFFQFSHATLTITSSLHLSIPPFSSSSVSRYVKLFTFYESSPGSVGVCRSSCSACSNRYSVHCVFDLRTVLTPSIILFPCFSPFPWIFFDINLITSTHLAKFSNCGARPTPDSWQIQFCIMSFSPSLVSNYHISLSLLMVVLSLLFFLLSI